VGKNIKINGEVIENVVGDLSESPEDAIWGR
jgi:hypothetical protein